MEKGKPGNTYNVGSGKAVTIQDILNRILSLSTKKITINIDPTKIRPIDVPIIEADITKIYNDTGWQPEISLDQTIQETLDIWRNKEGN